MEIRATDAMDAWTAALRHVMTHGQRFTDRSRRTCIEVANILVSFTQTDRDITAPIHAVEKSTDLVYPSLQELEEIMFMKGRSLYDYTYGQRLFNYREAFNQIDNYIIPLLAKTPHSRRAIVALYDPISDSAVDASTIPCLIALHFLVRDEKLHVTAYLRSNDLFVGFPADVYQLSVLQKYVAQRLEVGMGSISVFSNSTHIFEDQLDDIGRIIQSS
jgi:thymidylate synthase